MQGKKNLLLIIILLAALAGAAFYFLYFVRTPAYALNQARQAFQEHDSVKFSRYVDVHSVMDNAFEDILKAESKINNDNIYSNPFAIGILHMLKPAVVDLLTQEALHKIDAKPQEETPEQAQVNADPVPDAMRRNLERYISLGDLQVKDVHLEKHEGEKATATLVLHNKQLDKDFPAELLLQLNANNDWQIKRVSNLETVITQMDAAKRAQQAAADQAIMQRLNQALQATGERLTLNVDHKNDVDPMTVLSATIMAKNLTDVAINRMYYDVMIFNEQGQQIYSYPEHFRGSIAPGQAVELTTSKKLNPLLPDDKKLMEQDVNKDQCRIQVTYIAFDNGDVLSPNTFME